MSGQNEGQKIWAGFCDGRIDVLETSEHYIKDHRLLAIYPTRREAKYFYQDVRPVEVRQIKIKKFKKQKAGHKS